MSALRDALRDLSDAVFFDLLESDDAYLLVLDVPGVTAETLDVSVENGQVSIEARREKSLAGEFRYLEENRSLFLDATLPLPSDATESGAEAAVDRGVLELLLPKRATSVERTIDVVEPADEGEPTEATPVSVGDETDVGADEAVDGETDSADEDEDETEAENEDHTDDHLEDR